MKYVFAGDRQISVEILQFLISKGYKPEALLVSKGANESHAKALITTSNLPSSRIFEGQEFKSAEAIKFLTGLNLDYIFGIHFPYIIPKQVLDIPKVGFLNLHPAFLPYNKGWHTPSWAIIDKTPYGATLHFMAEELDAGDILHQKEINITPEDTANSLYFKVLALEVETFKEALPEILTLKPTRIKQTEKGTSKTKKDLAAIQEINLSATYTGEELVNKLRALTTNRIEEAAYFIKDGKKIAVQVSLEQIE
ncbi:MAG TPA: formyltransferase family protein [Flavobacteriaceae bacterium]|nr:formyltransferase family protein [Flavobacteriaceae bacterium]